MHEPREITLPDEVGELRGLTAGEEILLSGPVYAARDATHARIDDALRREGALPHGLAGRVLFYAGPTRPSPGLPAGSVGPTTAKRMDPWTPGLLRAGIAATIGKGPRSEEVRAACAETGSPYLVAVGGAAALLGSRVVSSEVVAYEELGAEALRRMVLERFPLFVGIDAAGDDIFAAIVPDGREVPR